MTAARQYRYIFGPVLSRRLGRSLGIDVVPMKTCTFNCVYCQLGRTTRQTLARQSYVPAAEVMAELRAFLAGGEPADYLTFSGSGEPTLHRELGEMIVQAKQMSTIPVAVLTCGALLYDAQVRAELCAADVVLPSLDAASASTFHDVNRPHGRLSLAAILAGLQHFRREYQGQIWLEIMLVKGVNDSPQEIEHFRRLLAEIRPDKIHLNTVVRPPAEGEVQPLSPAELQALAEVIGPPAEAIAERPALDKLASENHLVSEVVNLLARHPCTLEEISAYVNIQQESVRRVLHALLAAGVVATHDHRGRQYYTAVSRSGETESG